MLLALDPHQTEGVEFAIDRKYALLTYEMGLGKTPIALAVAEKTKCKTLLVVPAYLILNWQKEIEKFLGPDTRVRAIKNSRQVSPPIDEQFCLVSYDIAKNAECLFEWADMVVFDEGHMLKSMKAKRTQAMHKFVFENNMKRVLILTGTPIKNRVEEYYSLIALMNYNPKNETPDFLDRFPDSVAFADYFSFRTEFTVKISHWKSFKVIKWDGIRNVKELKQYLKPHYIRKRSADILTLEPIRRKDILISEKPDPELFKLYENSEGKIKQKVDVGKKAFAALWKVPFTVKYVTQILEEVGAVVIFTDHVESCKQLAKAFKVEPITGETPMTKRQALADGFQKGEFPVIVATVGSFSTGRDLTRASNLVFNDFPWTPGDIKQAEYRIQRRSQTKSCVVHYVLGSPQDSYILNTIREKDLTIEKAT